MSDIHPLTDFLRNHKSHIQRLKRDQRPEILTINGKAELIVQDTESYQKLIEAVERAEVIAGIQKGLDSMRAGKGRPAREVERQMRKKLKLAQR